MFLHQFDVFFNGADTNSFKPDLLVNGRVFRNEYHFSRRIFINAITSLSDPAIVHHELGGDFCNKQVYKGTDKVQTL